MKFAGDLTSGNVRGSLWKVDDLIRYGLMNGMTPTQVAKAAKSTADDVADGLNRNLGLAPEPILVDGPRLSVRDLDDLPGHVLPSTLGTATADQVATGERITARAAELGHAPSASEETLGGRYTDVHKSNSGGEVQHTPAKAVSPYTDGTGPSVFMSKEDHRRTASWGNDADAQAYRKKQSELVKAGRTREAIQMDIDDLRSKFGSKYDPAISQMLKTFENI